MLTEDAVEKAFLLEGIELRHNNFAHVTMIRYGMKPEKELAELDRAKLDLILLKHDIKLSARLTEACVMVIADRNSFHPVCEYLNNLVWDGVSRLDRWLIDYMGAEDTPLNRAIGKIVLTAAVRRVRQPGCKFDECLVLVGKEGIGKSTAIKILAGEWFSDNLPMGSETKEAVEQTNNVWLCESAELVGNSSAMIERVKAFLSRSVDGPFRKAFGRLPGKVARQFIPIGTTNSASFLHSTTGDRRFWPVKVYFSSKAIADFRDQLWAEAAFLEAAGESIRLDETLWDAAREVQESYRAQDPWETVLATLDGPSYSLPQILERLGIHTDRATGKDGQRIQGIMHKLDYINVGRKMANGVRSTWYEKRTPFHEDSFVHGPMEPEQDMPEPEPGTPEYERLQAELEGRMIAEDLCE